MANAQDYLYTKEHEWLAVEGTKVRVGVTDYAQQELGDVVFVELPSVDDDVEESEGFAVIESVKAVSDIYAPVSGKVVKVNENLEDSPELINESPEADGWIAEIELSDEGQLKDLMSVTEYEKYIREV